MTPSEQKVLPLTYRLHTTPYLHQQLLLEQTWSFEWWGLILDMGTGKSKIFLDTAAAQAEARMIQQIAIIAPKGNYANWTDKEIPKHLSPEFRERLLVHRWRGGHTAGERHDLKRLMDERERIGVLVMNTEAISQSRRACQAMDMFLSRRPTILGVDESSTIKNRDAERTKKIVDMGRRARSRRTMTGTPNPRSPMDLYSQFEFLSPGCLGFRSFFTFRSRYAVLKDEYFGGRRVTVEVAYRNIPDLRDRVRRNATVLRKEDCLDLPPKVYAPPRNVELKDEQRRLYNELTSRALADLQGGSTMSYDQKIVLRLRLQQICSGLAVDDDGVEHHIPHGRGTALVELLDETDQAALVWCRFRHDVEEVKRALDEAKITWIEYDGTMASVDRFQDESGPRVFLSTVFRGGYGLTLTRASLVVYYSQTDDLEKRLQTEDRAHRIGQTRSVTIVDLRVMGSVEDDILDNNAGKNSIQNQIKDDDWFKNMLARRLGD